MESLAFSRKYINKDFLGKVGERVLTLFRSGNIHERELAGILSNIAEIEVILHTRSFYVQSLDTLYELSLPTLFAEAERLPDPILNRLVSALRRSKYFD